MSDLVQIVYISRSTFKPLAAEQGIEPNVARILAQSRINNAKRGLVGALYFGDGCFFQCLEGSATQVDGLYAALLKDPRHTDLKVLSRASIEQTQFTTWSMKYVPLDSQMKDLLQRRGLATFDPYAFDHATVEQVLQLLQAGGDTPSVDPGRSIDRPFEVLTDPKVERALKTSRLSLAIALLALAVSLLSAWPITN